MPILIVDDDPGICDLLGLFLAHNGYATVSAQRQGRAESA